MNTPHNTEINNTSAPELTGRLITSVRGFGFVITEDEERIDIPDRSALNTALHGDTVQITVFPKKTGEENRTGKVKHIEKRAKERFVGTIQKNANSAFLIPDYNKMYTDIFIPLSALQGGKTGEKALVEIVGWKDPQKAPQGKVLKVIGKKGEHETEMRSALLERGFTATFPDEVEEEAKGITREIHEDEIKKRRDMRTAMTFTIDPDDAKDFDDALSHKILENGDVEIGIHIADVTHYVRPGMKIDAEAYERATSVYLVDRTVPMLPEVLSNDMCSLRPHEDRLAFSAVFTFSKDSFGEDDHFEMKDAWYGRTVIHSDRRFTYKEAEDVLDGKSEEYKKEIIMMHTLSKKMRKARFENGAVEFETDEIKIVLNEYGEPQDVIKKEHLETHGLIEEYMLLANKNVARHATEKIEARNNDDPFIYRVHAEPDPERMQEFITFIEQFGYHLKMKDGSVSSSDLNRVLKESTGTPEENIIHTSAIRTMSKAIYSTQNIGHFGLAFDYYTHFTSPIRRYPDMEVHRLFHKYLCDEKIPEEDVARMRTLVDYTSEREQDAAGAERESIKYKQVQFLENRIGEIFQGVISGISRSGMFVQDEETFAEGLIRLRDLSDDFYELDDENHQFVGKKTGKKYRLGDEIKIKLTKVDLDKRQLDFTVA